MPKTEAVLRQFVRTEKHYLLLLAPLLIFVFVVAIYPLSFAFFISFFKYRLTDPNQTRTFLWFSNYLAAFNDPQVIKSLTNTLVFVFGTVAIELVFGLALALLLSAETWTMQIIRSFLLIPMAIPPLVVGLVWKSLYNVDFGVIPYYIKLLGADAGRGPLGELSTAMGAIILIDVWQWTPLLMVIFLAGLKSLPHDPYEAAVVDGATRWQSFWYITLPYAQAHHFNWAVTTHHPIIQSVRYYLCHHRRRAGQRHHRAKLPYLHRRDDLF